MTVPLPLLTPIAILGVCCLVAGAAIVRGHPGYRIGRLLRAAPEVSVAEAVAFADDTARYVRVRGRVTSDEEFPDENDRPLVYRRRRIEVARRPGRWEAVQDDREAVAFGVEERSASIRVAADELAEGLVVLPRIASGRASELPESPVLDLPDLPGDAEVRLRLEQVSAVELATVAGVPRLRDGLPTLGSGLGRPLILTTLELPAAMRVLGGGRRARLALASSLFVAGLGLIALAIVAVLVGIRVG